MTPEALVTLEKQIADIGKDWEKVKTLPADFQDYKTLMAGLPEDVKKLNATVAAARSAFEDLRRSRNQPAYRPTDGKTVSRECAIAIACCGLAGALERGPNAFTPGARDMINAELKNLLGVEAKAYTTSDVPLPLEYFAEIRGIITPYGIARKAMTNFPIGRGTMKLPRFGTWDDFALIALSGPVNEKKATITFATLSSHKYGGLCRVPREIEEQSIVPIGQYLAVYGANKFDKIEDAIAFLADGSGTYDGRNGVIATAITNSLQILTPAAKTHPSDVTLDQLRALRGLLPAPVLATGKYYMHPTWEAALRKMRAVPAGTSGGAIDPSVFVDASPAGPARFDGFEIVWTNIMPVYGTAVNAAASVAIFGNLSYWWFGLRTGSPRVDFSTEVYFATDELATRFLIELDVDYMSANAASVLTLAAA